MGLVERAPALWPRPFTVVRRRRENDEVVTLELAPREEATVEGGPPLPGQFHMLYVFGVGEVPISIAGITPAGEVVHTVRAVGAVSAALCAARPGAVIGVRGPYGTPWPLDAVRGRDVVLVAGGIGLAPLRPVLLALLSPGAERGRLTLIYGARSPEQLIYRHELDAWRSDRRHAGGCELAVTVDHPGAGWSGPVGLVTALLPNARFAPARCVAMLCGPEVMMRFAARELGRLGVAAADLHLSLERNMKCAVGLCGRCQLAPHFVCRHGPVFSWPQVAPWLALGEV